MILGLGREDREEGSKEANQNLVKDNYHEGASKPCTGLSVKENHNHPEAPTNFKVKIKMKLQGFESPQ